MITIEYLKKHNACQEGISFFERNNLEGFPLSRLLEIKGDYNKYVEWLKNLSELFCDSKENKINEVCPNGRVYEYDSKGNKIKVVYPNGDVGEWKYEYDSNGNLINKIYPNGDVVKWKYEYLNYKLHRIYKNNRLILEIPEF